MFTKYYFSFFVRYSRTYVFYDWNGNGDYKKRKYTYMYFVTKWKYIEHGNTKLVYNIIIHCSHYGGSICAVIATYTEGTVPTLGLAGW